MKLILPSSVYEKIKAAIKLHPEAEAILLTSHELVSVYEELLLAGNSQAVLVGSSHNRCLVLSGKTYPVIIQRGQS